MKRLCLLLATLTAILLCVNIYALADDNTIFTAVLSVVEGEPEAETELTVTYSGQPVFTDTLMCRVAFNTEQLTLQGVTEPKLEEFYSVTVPYNGWVETCCVSNDDTGATLSSDTVFKYRFAVAQAAQTDETVLTVTLTVGDTTAQSDVVFTVLPKPNTSTQLVSLSPAVGQLTPEFTTENLAYTLTVPSDVDTLTFNAQPADGATCKINRKNLGKAGTTTDFKLTVTAADGKTQSVYTVAVHREEASPSPTKTPSPTATPIPTATPTATPPQSHPTAEISPTPTAKPTPTTQPASTQPTPTPEPAATPPQATVTASTQYITTPPVTLRGTGTNMLPLAAALIILIAAIGVSKPLAHALATLISRKNHGDNDK